MSHELRLLRVERVGRVAYASIDNPPVNLMTARLVRELESFGHQCADDPDVSVVVLDSADDEFFIAHFDVERILGSPTEGEPQRSTELNVMHQVCELYRRMPKATICAIAGRVGGGGSELASSCDMRFGVIGRTIVNQMEVPLGILPAGGGTQALPRLIGRGRALELILGGDDLDADTAARWGYLNRVFPDAAAMRAHAWALAERIGSHPPEAVAIAKQAVLTAELEWREGLLEEEYALERLLRTDEAARNMRAFLSGGGQTRDGEREVARLTGRLGRARAVDEDEGSE